jgi:hypothetical protein
VLEFESLDLAHPANQTIVQYAGNLAPQAGIAYMTNDYFGAVNGAGAACGDNQKLTKPRPCTPDEYLQLLANGIWPLYPNTDVTARFLEVFPPDVLAGGDAICTAHYALVGSRAAGCQASTDPRSASGPGSGPPTCGPTAPSQNCPRQ